jgi:hypothetical protein
LRRAARTGEQHDVEQPAIHSWWAWGIPSLSLRSTALWIAVLFTALVWVYYPTLDTVVRRWSTDPQYTHGYVVPLFAAIVLWFRRDRFPSAA